MLTPEPGTIVGEKYRILRLLGEGGMGSVYEAENTLTLKRAAIKWLHPRLVAVEEAGKRLLYEARAMARIRHRNVVDIYDVVLEHDSVFLVMELLLGEQLSDLLAREPPHMHELIALLLPAMRGLAAAHAAGVVHRDIKPDNIFLARESDSSVTPKVIDFGISRLFEADGGRLTRSGMTMGTPRYVSYEQLRGVRDVDQRADIYAFGVILYECLVGDPPYIASTFSEQAISFVTTEPRAPRQLRPDVPAELDALLSSTIAKDREQRPPTMQALIAGLTPFAEPGSYAEPLRCFAPRLAPLARSMEVFPDQTTAPATRTPLPEHKPASNASQVAPSLPTPKLIEAPRRRRWAIGLLALAAAVGLVLFVERERSVAPSSKRAAPAPAASSAAAPPSQPLLPALAAPADGSPTAAAAEPGVPPALGADAGAATALPEPPARTYLGRPRRVPAGAPRAVDAPGPAHAGAREQHQPPAGAGAPGTAAQRPAAQPQAGEQGGDSARSGSEHRAGAMRPDEF